MREFSLTSRQSNAVRVTLDGIERSYRERLPELISENRTRLSSTRRRLGKTDDRFKRHQLQRRIACIEERIAAYRRDLAAGTMRICFGSRKLFGAQHHLVANAFADRDAWKATWREARSNAFFVLGSKDETAGCQGCVMRHEGNGRFSVQLRLPNALVDKHMVFEVRFRYGWEQLAYALDARQALSYRFRRDAKGWRVFVSTAPPVISIASKIAYGVLGVDLNADHIALSRTNRHGNVVWSKRLHLITYGASREQSKARLGDAVVQVVQEAVRYGVPIALERLDFSKKKCALREHGARYARMLSSFVYTRFDKMLRARAHDAGIAVIAVNPAYSSLIGKEKFARRYGLSSHQSAALVLARRAQGCSERPNRRDLVALHSPVRKNARHVWSHWARLARQRAGDAPRRWSHTRDPGSAAAESATLPSSAGGIPAREPVANAVWATSLAS